MSEDPQRDDPGREIIRAWRIRGEHEKVYEVEGAAYMLFGLVVLVGIVICVILSVLGIEW